MKQCPKCSASIIDTAKFCSKCGVNIKKYEEANTKVRFCPECGTAIMGGNFCTECGFSIITALTDTDFGSYDNFGDGCPDDTKIGMTETVGKSCEIDEQLQIKQALVPFEYEEHPDGTYTITGLKDKNALRYVVPNNVVAISDNAFEGCDAIKITLSDDVLQIGNCAFKGCRNLSNINLPIGLTIVGDEAFAECEILDIELPETIRKIGKDAIKNTVQDKAQRAAEAEELARWELGGSPIFGLYYQSENNKQPIEWRVLKREGSKALLISKYLLDYKQHYSQEGVFLSWQSSNLRRWLNNEFLAEAFTDTEQQKIRITEISTPKNTKYNTCGSDMTTDKIFVLSIDEAELYFASNYERKGVDAKNKGLSKSWWLRSPGAKNTMFACVDSDGAVYDYGVDSTTSMGVRPALWIDLEA